MKNSWQEEYAVLCRKQSFEDLVKELLHVAFTIGSLPDGFMYQQARWKITFLKKEIIARYKNK